MSPTDRPCAAAVLTVTVLPDSVRPGRGERDRAAARAWRGPEIGFVYVNDRDVGTDVTVNVPL